MHKLLSGFEQFRRGYYTENREFFQQLATKQQKPIALFITCADSRIHPNQLTNTEAGDLFLIRNAGNIVPPHGFAGGEAATIEYSVEVLGIRDVVICGHSQCGAVQAMLNSDKVAHLPNVRAWCHHAEAARRIVEHKYKDLSPNELPVVAAKANVLVQMHNLSTHPSIAARLSAGELRVFGWYYDIGEGQVWQYDESVGRFEPLKSDAPSVPPMSVLAAI